MWDSLVLISDSIILFLIVKSETLFANCCFMLRADEILDFKLEWFSVAEDEDCSDNESLSVFNWMLFSNFLISCFLFSIILLTKLMDWNKPSISLLREINFVSFEILELLSIITVPPLASKNSPPIVTAL